MSSLFRTSLSSITLVLGEKMMKGKEEVIVNGEIAQMFHSNFRLLFHLDAGTVLSVPIHAIVYIIFKPNGNKGSSSVFLQLCGLHSLTLSSPKPDVLYKLLQRLAKSYKSGNRCALSIIDTPELMKQSYTANGPLLWPQFYFERFVNTLLDSRWRLSTINRSYHVCPRYSKSLCVPVSVSDKMIVNSSLSLTDGCVPILTWTNPDTRTFIFRGSIINTESEAAMMYWKAIENSAKPNGIVPILIEEAQCNFSEISSIALFVSSEEEISLLLDEITQLEIVEPFSLDTCPELSRWQRRLRSAMNSFKAVANMILKENNSIFLQSNSRGGPIFTISAGTQLIVDPYFRTLRGFCSLIEKEFVYFGFPFQGAPKKEKYRSAATPVSLVEYAGCFVLFMDCVWALLSQIGFAFEFNKELLIFLCDTHSAGLYDTFAYSCEKDRKVEYYRSVWGFILQRPSSFLNPNYKAEDSLRLAQMMDLNFNSTWNSWLIQRKLGFMKLNKDPTYSMVSAFQKKDIELDLTNHRLVYFHKDWLQLLEHLVIIDFSHNYLTDFPMEILNLPNLCQLNLDNNLINKLPSDWRVGHLQVRLRLLSMNYNKITKFPNDFPVPSSLRCLSLCHNKIQRFELGKVADRLIELRLTANSLNHISFNAPRLRSLWLDDNKLKSIPECILSFHELATLKLSRNPIHPQLASFQTDSCIWKELDVSGIPLGSSLNGLTGSLFAISSLTALSLQNCFSVSFPPSLGNLCDIVTLHIGNNQLEKIPECVGSLQALEFLSLADNAVTSLPTFLLDLKCLNYLDVRKNGIKTFPGWLPGVGNLKETENFFFSDNPIDASYLCNGIFPTCSTLFLALHPTAEHEIVPIISLYFAGPPGAGKSHLLRSYFPSLTTEPPTTTIDTIRLYPTISHDINETEFLLRLRKFGGFGPRDSKFYEWFLEGTRAIFVVVWRASQSLEDPNLRFWMDNAIRYRSSVCIIVIIITTPDLISPEEVKGRFLQKYLRTRYPIIRVLVVAQHDIISSMDQFNEALSQAVQCGKIVEETFPVAFGVEKFRNAFLANKKVGQCPVLSVRLYKERIAPFGITTKEKYEQSICYLQQSGKGVLVHDNVILDLNWFDRIFSCIRLVDTKGKLDHLGLIESRLVLKNIYSFFPDRSYCASQIIELLAACKILYIFQGHILLPNLLEWRNEEKGAFYDSYVLDCPASYSIPLQYVPLQMIHFLSVRCFSTIVECMDASCIQFFCLYEWSVKESSGNLIFFTITSENALSLSATQASPAFEQLWHQIGIVLDSFRQLVLRPKSTLQHSASKNWLSFK